jgi:hypothetical protein
MPKYGFNSENFYPEPNTKDSLRRLPFSIHKKTLNISHQQSSINNQASGFNQVFVMLTYIQTDFFIFL